MKTIIKYIVLLCAGGALYACCELVFRGYTFKTMAFVGGACFVLCGLVNEFIDWKIPLPLQMLICAVIVTAVEFVAGVILNIGLDLNMWDYSNLRFNIWGRYARNSSQFGFYWHYQQSHLTTGCAGGYSEKKNRSII